jgi:hypothetical protein
MINGITWVVLLLVFLYLLLAGSYFLHKN